MSKISIEDTKSVLSQEDELQEKLEGLENSMVNLLNKLNEEKKKLLEAKNINLNISNNSNETIDIYPVRDHSISQNNIKHISNCPNSRIILEIDPNCAIHGHIYNSQYQINPNSVLTNFSTKSLNNITESDENSISAAAGDVNHELSANYLKLLNNFSPGEYSSESRKMLAYHLQRICQIDTDISFDNQTKSNVNDNINIIHEKEIDDEINDKSSPNIVELQKIDNSENLLKNDLNKSEKNLIELTEKYFKNNSIDLENNNSVSDKNLEFKDLQINSAYLENELEELNASINDEGELDMLLKALKLSYYGSFLEELPKNIVEELQQQNKLSN